MESELKNLKEEVKQLMIEMVLIKRKLIEDREFENLKCSDSLMDENLLAEDWLSPEDEEAWKDL